MLAMLWFSVRGSLFVYYSQPNYFFLISCLISPILGPLFKQPPVKFAPLGYRRDQRTVNRGMRGWKIGAGKGMSI